MIGAGVGWYVLRHPPITTALIGYGLFSLLRTHAPAQPHAQRDYVRQGQERLKEQMIEFASRVADKASVMGQEAGETIVEKSGELFDAAKDQAARLAHDTGQKISVGMSAVQDQVSSVLANAGGMAADISHRAEHAKQRAFSQVSRSSDSIAAARSALPEGDARDRLLLGVAALGIAAALGVAWQRRLTGNIQAL